MVSIAKFDQWQSTSGVPFGTILQVVSKNAVNPYAQAVTANTWLTYPGSEMALSITPRFATSKVLIIASITIGANANNAGYRFTRGGTPIGVGSAQGTRQRGSAITGWLNTADTNHTFRTVTQQFLDSPATTSATTYNIDIMGESTIVYLNRSGAYTDNTTVYSATYTSNLTLMEIAQ